MISFDYLYYRTYDTYQRKWNENMPKLYAIALVSLMQSFNIFILPFVLELFSLIDLEENGINEYYFGGFVFLPIIFNYIRYTKFMTFQKMESKWEKENERVRKRKDWNLIVYIVLSIGVTLSLAIILGEINQGRL